jgi:2,3-bisphosphoglycerate-independent phosphoglycerate mutase
MKKQQIMLIILDGWGLDRDWGGNAIYLAKKPAYDQLIKDFPHTRLLASGVDVGLPDSARGNSEAGHLNIGAGRIVHQDIDNINREIKNGTFYSNPNLNKAIDWAIEKKSNLHLMGLLSDGGNHSHIAHLYSLLEICKIKGLNRVYLDLFTDGRDSSPDSGVRYIRGLENKLKEIGFGKISSISGRYYAMDRDNRWGRTSRAYNALVQGLGESYESAEAGVLNSYGNRVTDEFIVPFLVQNKGQIKTPISDNDSVIFFNFRTDRAKQLTSAFVSDNFNGFLDRRLLRDLLFVTFMPFEENLPVHSAFGPEKVRQPLAEYISDLKLKQFHIAETEKYAHVTYYFNGMIRQPFPGEERQLIPSPKVLTYDRAPKMSANAVKEALIKEISKGFDFYLANFANPDMVGHTGNLGATILAVEEVDRCLNEVLISAKNNEMLVIVTADHGNAEKMIDMFSGEANTEHTANPVPLIIADFGKDKKNLLKLREGRLSDIAPTIIDYLDFGQSKYFSGQSLVI